MPGELESGDLSYDLVPWSYKPAPVERLTKSEPQYNSAAGFPVTRILSSVRSGAEDSAPGHGLPGEPIFTSLISVEKRM